MKSFVLLLLLPIFVKGAKILLKNESEYLNSDVLKVSLAEKGHKVDIDSDEIRDFDVVLTDDLSVARAAKHSNKTVIMLKTKRTLDGGRTTFYQRLANFWFATSKLSTTKKTLYDFVVGLNFDNDETRILSPSLFYHSAGEERRLSHWIDQVAIKQLKIEEENSCIDFCQIILF